MKAFQDHKLTLADRHLKNKINREIHILLGVNGAHILPLISCSFGMTDNNSLVYNTSIGILLAGDLNKLIKNLPYLHGVKYFSEQVALLQKKVKSNSKME